MQTFGLCVHKCTGSCLGVAKEALGAPSKPCTVKEWTTMTAMLHVAHSPLFLPTKSKNLQVQPPLNESSRFPMESLIYPRENNAYHGEYAKIIARYYEGVVRKRLQLAFSDGEKKL